MIKNKWTVKIILLVTVILAGFYALIQLMVFQMQKQIIKKYILQCLMLIKKII